MSRQVRVGYGRLAAVALAVVATTWGAGTAVAAAGGGTVLDALTSATTAPGTPAPGTPAPSGSGTVPDSTSPTPCPPGPGTAATAPPPPSDFEDGSVGRWTADAGVTLTNTGEAAAHGERSLRAGGLTDIAGIRLPSDSSLAPATNWLRVTAKVRLAPGTAPAYVQLKPSGSYSAFPGVVRATASEWTTITAWYSPFIVYWDGYCNGQMYGGSYPALATLTVFLSGNACSDATRGPVTVFVDDVVTEAVDASAPRAGPPPEPPSTPRCGPASSSAPAPVCTAHDLPWINVSAQSGWSSGTAMYWKFARAGKLCGSNGQLWGAAPQVSAKA
jgi:hypothetical protein